MGLQCVCSTRYNNIYRPTDTAMQSRCHLYTSWWYTSNVFTMCRLTTMICWPEDSHEDEEGKGHTLVQKLLAPRWLLHDA